MKVRHALKTLVRFVAFATAELRRLPRDAAVYAIWQKTEEQLLQERLARRYDPGQALNESFERAAKAIGQGKLQQGPPSTSPSKDAFINSYYENMRRNPPLLTLRQREALKVQEQTLRRNLDQAARKPPA